LPTAAVFCRCAAAAATAAAAAAIGTLAAASAAASQQLPTKLFIASLNTECSAVMVGQFLPSTRLVTRLEYKNGRSTIIFFDKRRTTEIDVKCNGNHEVL